MSNEDILNKLTLTPQQFTAAAATHSNELLRGHHEQHIHGVSTEKEQMKTVYQVDNCNAERLQPPQDSNSKSDGLSIFNQGPINSPMIPQLFNQGIMQMQ